MKYYIIFSYVLLILIYSCNSKISHQISDNKKVDTTIKTISISQFPLEKLIQDSKLEFVLKNKTLIIYYINKYRNDSCEVKTYEALDTLKYSDKNIKDFNHDGKPDKIFTIEPKTICDYPCYYFSDTTIPRLETFTECISSSCIENIGDIDEDGVDELLEFHNQCVSRFKTLHILKLQKNKWIIIGEVCFDTFHHNYDNENLKSYFKKISKYKFKLKEKSGDENYKIYWHFFDIRKKPLIPYTF